MASVAARVRRRHKRQAEVAEGGDMPQKKSRVEEKKNEEFRRRWRIAKKLAQDELVWKDKRIQQLEKLVSKLEERVSKESEDVVALCSSDEELFESPPSTNENKVYIC